MDPLPIVIALWSFGVLVAVGVPALVLVRARRAWTRLPHTRALVAGPGPSIATQDLALLSFLDAWKESGFERQVELREALKHLHIAWREGQYFTMPDSGDLKMRGRTVNSKMIVIALWHGAALGDTAFFHELTHFALWTLYGEPDPDHVEERWQGWTAAHDEMIAELKAVHRMRDGAALTRGESAQSLSAFPVENVQLCGTCLRSR